ncbi:DUF2970 domain-containing protein [Rheinheimera sp.]|uniref:DUF2970 domain-containing protein n=1 Tax=Rheinheimera sp. TaxID=1869214 RepID=UPI0027BA74F1|nr:DUF2970 domain-containing protein [Rheinheimera sp.]
MKQQPGLKQVFKAVAGALIGVQSEQQRQQDFNSNSPMPYILVGIIVTVLFVVTLLLIVRAVLP